MACESIYDARLPINGRSIALYKLAKWKNGMAFKKADFSSTGLPIIKIAELNGGISDSTAWTEGDYGKDVFLTKGDYVFSWSGNPETSIDIFRYNLQDGWLNQHIFKVTPETGLVREEYFFFLMKWLKPVFKKIAANKQTTGLGHVTLADLKRIQVTIPSFEVQERIERILCPLDFKIRLNNQLNDYLEQLCQSLFDRFDNDENNLFVKVSDIADVNPRRTLKKGEEALCVEMADLSTTGAFPTDWRTKAYNGGVKFVNGDTILARITPCLENGKAGYINFLEQDEVAFGSTEYIVLTSKGELPSEFFYFLARNEDFISYATAHMNGSSGRQRVSGADVGNYEVRMPSEKQVSEFKEIAGKAMRVISASSIESRKLAQSRDALLPKLMSGEIDVSEVDLTQPTNNHLADC